MPKPKKESLIIEIDKKLKDDLVWLSKQKDENGEKHSISEIVETALLLTFTTLNAYHKKQKKMN